MKKVQGVSLPRCGHNLLVKHLQRYFSSSDVCPDYRKRFLPFVAKAKMRRSSMASHHHNQLTESPFHYCEFYYSCRTVPCCDGRNVFQKSHDFELDLPSKQDSNYIIQIRNPLGLLISWFELRLPRKREIDTPEGFIAFTKRMQPYLDGFRNKWIESDLPNRLIIDYDAYLERPDFWLGRVIEMFEPARRCESKILKDITSDVQTARINSDFRYYEAAISSGFFQDSIAA